MVEVKVYRTGNLTGANVSHTSAYPIVGYLEKIYVKYDGGNTGSIEVIESGTALNLYTKTSFSADINDYPRKQVVDTSAAAFYSGANVLEKHIVSTPLIIVGSGIPAGSTISAEIYYT